VSASWTRVTGQTIDAITAGVGSSDGPEPQFVRNGAFVEGARHFRGNTLYGRIEILKIDPHIAGVNAASFTVGGVRDILNRHGFECGIGAAVTLATMLRCSTRSTDRIRRDSRCSSGYGAPSIWST